MPASDPFASAPGEGAPIMGQPMDGGAFPSQPIMDGAAAAPFADPSAVAPVGNPIGQPPNLDGASPPASNLADPVSTAQQDPLAEAPDNGVRKAASMHDVASSTAQAASNNVRPTNQRHQSMPHHAALSQAYHTRKLVPILDA